MSLIITVVHERYSLRITSFKADHVLSTAHTLMSTSPNGNAVPRTVSSVTSEGTPEDFFGQDTQITVLAYFAEAAVQLGIQFAFRFREEVP